MRLNLPILDQLQNSQSILIAGAGGGFDVFAGLPLYFSLREAGKTVHLANYSFTELGLAALFGAVEVVIKDVLVGACAPVERLVPGYPEGYLSQWFKDTRDEDVTIWMFPNAGAVPLIEGYHALKDRLGFDALVLIDGGVDSLMRGDELGAGTLVEDSISLTAADSLDVPVKILACLGFGTEVEEGVCHYNALENMAALAREGAFLGSCALTPQMEVFQLYEAACRYVWEQPHHPKSHISTRIIPAVKGEFGNYHMYRDERQTTILVSPLMSLYWFFDANAVIRRNMLIDLLRKTHIKMEAFHLVQDLLRKTPLRRRQSLPY